MKYISKMYTLEVKILYIGASRDSYHICVLEIIFIEDLFIFRSKRISHFILLGKIYYKYKLVHKRIFYNP